MKKNTSSVAALILGLCLYSPAMAGDSGPGAKMAKKLLEPPDGFVLHGAGQCPDSFGEYFKTLKKTPPLIYMTYVGLKENIPSYFAALEAELERYPAYLIPQIGLGMTTGQADYTQEVADGKYDDKIREFLDGLKKLKRPAFVRVGYEFNGDWNHYKPESYKKAFRYIVKASRRAGIADTAYVWCYAPDGTFKNYMDYYPGDNYVDWWSLDYFNDSDAGAQDVLSFTRDAKKHGFPVMIGESTPRGTGVLEGETSWKKWFENYFRFIRENPHVKAFCYINWDWTNLPGIPEWAWWGDARIQANEVVKKKYLLEMSDRRYIHGMGIHETRSLLGLKHEQTESRIQDSEIRIGDKSVILNTNAWILDFNSRLQAELFSRPLNPGRP